MRTIKSIGLWLKLCLLTIIMIGGVSCSQVDDVSSEENEISSKAILSGGIVIHFEKPSSWSGAWIWYDQHSDGSWETTQTSQSPGDMVKYRTVNGKDWYKKELSNTSSVTFLFNQGDWGATIKDNGSDFTATADIWVNEDGSYSLSDPHGSGGTDFTVYFKKPSGWGSSINIYSWTGSGGSVTKVSGDWPGTAMTSASKEGTDWYKYTITGQSSVSLIFNDGSNQTSDLTRDKDGWYKDSQWHDANPEQGSAPVISITPSGQTFATSPFNVNIKINSNNSIVTRTRTITVNGGSPVVTNLSSNDVNIDLTTLMSAGDTLTLQVYAKDSNGLETTSNTESFTYQQSTGLTIYFKKPSDWGNPNIYAWKGSSTPLTGGWPGTSMTSEGGDWYSYTVANESSANIVFNDGSKQTADLSRSANGWFEVTGQSNGKYTGTWYDSNPDDSIDPTISITSPAEYSTVAGNVNVTVSASDNVGVSRVEYYFNNIKIGESSSSPYTFNWDTTGGASKTANLKAVAFDGAGNSSLDEISITTNNPNQAPIANAGADITVEKGTTCNFDGTSSYDNDGTVVSYSWSDGKGGTMTGSTPSTVYTNSGEYTVTLTVADNEGATASDQLKVTVTDGPVASDFSWDNATVYFVITDRFYNGNTNNDNSYGRRNNYGSGALSVGTFHGGDIAGLTSKLDYLDDLGVNAIWITATYEQMHGFCGGADGGNFPHYGYHGYYTLDYTAMDKNMGTEDEMREFVKQAHSRGMRVIMDIVLNHPGYNTALDAMQYGFGGNPQNKSEQDAINWTPSGGQNWHAYHDLFFDYNSSSAWSNWWSSSWIRSGLPGHEFVTDNADQDALRCNLSDLPDFLTERTGGVSAAPVLSTKWSMEGNSHEPWIIDSAVSLRQNLNVAPADYVVKWLAAWVEEFGIDGFRCDTAKHVDLYRWNQLKNACKTALSSWRNSSRSNGDAGKSWTDDFWMTGEHWNFNKGGGNHSQGDYYSNGFDNMIDFGYKDSVPSMGSLEGKFNSYANSKLLPYISSHDTGNVYWNGDSGRQKWAGTALLLNPSPVQIFYGDEIGRDNGNNGGDPDQGSRSDFQWSKVDNAINTHWKKIGKFRQRHVAIGAGQHSKLSDSPYTFSRVKNSDKVVVCLGASGSTQVNVSGIFSNGTQVRNAYDGSTTTVSNGRATFSGDVILIETVQ